MRFIVSTLLLGLLLSIAPVSQKGLGKGSQEVRPGVGDKEKVRVALNKLIEDFEYGPKDRCAVVVVSSQRMYLFEGERVHTVYAISTSKYGVGSEEKSNKTPLGTHRVEKKYGDGAPLGTIFRARGNTGKVAKIHRQPVDLDEDLVTTRILWLRGLEEGVNSGEGIDSYDRFIYIHGTPEEGLIGTPASHGCVRMINEQVIEAFDFIPEKGLIEIAP